MNYEYSEPLIEYEKRILAERLATAFRKCNTVSYVWAFSLSCCLLIASSIYEYPTNFASWMITSGVVYLLALALDAAAYSLVKNDATRATIWNVSRNVMIILQSVYGGYALALAWIVEFDSMTYAILGRTLAILNIVNQLIQTMPFAIQNIAIIHS